jgi:hypothetical protein
MAHSGYFSRAFLLPLARIIARDVVVTEEREGIDSEVVERPVAVLGNEREPVCMFFLQLIAPLIRVVALCSSMPTRAD